MAGRCIIYLHIPKTAGVTLRHVFRWKYPTSQRLVVETLWTDFPKQLENISLSERRNARVVVGTMHYGLHNYMPKECRYVTILREPVSRILSMYRYIHGAPEHWLHDEMIRSDMSLEDFVENYADPSVDNQQTRLLSGKREKDDFVSGRKPSDLNEAVLDEAKRNLEECLQFGLTDRFDESFIMIRRALRWKLPLYISTNVSRGKVKPPTEREIELIRERNQFDLQLYDFAQELFSKRVEEQGAWLQREVAAFRKMNRAANRMFPICKRMVRRLYPARFPEPRRQ